MRLSRRPIRGILDGRRGFAEADLDEVGGMFAMNTQPPCDWVSLSGTSNVDPMLTFEIQVAQSGSRAIAGVDEAGRGPLAGPIVAAAVMLGEPVPGVDDSKRLTEKQRESLFETLMSGPHAIAFEAIDPATIDANGIQSANYAAMAGALAKLDPAPDFALVDGFTIRGCMLPQLRIVKGDQRSQSIAAASIIAKVTRDRIMHELNVKYPEYGFASHKGYATQRHMDAIQTYGPCPIHRKSFAPISSALESLYLFQEQDQAI